jgi:sec-independent protein translocase protein TatB
MAITPPIQLASISMADSLILMVLALVVFGPRRLPQIGRQIGKLMYEFRKASNDFKFQMEEELRISEEADRRKKEEAERAARMAALPAPTQTIEASASTTAAEQESVSAQPYPAQHPAETDASMPAEGNSATLVIKPPSTGEQVEAAKPGADAVTGPTAAINSEAASFSSSNGTEPSGSGQESRQEQTGSETLSQHG